MAHALVVVAHPDPSSLTHAIALRVREALPPGAAEIADLAAEGFDPRYTVEDRAAYQGAAGLVTDAVQRGPAYLSANGCFRFSAVLSIQR